jgi:hypothetical protein
VRSACETRGVTFPEFQEEPVFSHWGVYFSPIANMANLDESTTLATLRFALLGILFIAAGGTALELLLLEHFESKTQLIPLGLLGASLAAIVWVTLTRSSGSVRVFRAVMVLLIVGGLAGLYLHYQGNAAFELDVEPDMEGLKLFKAAITGATPALAPGSLIQMGLLGLAYTFRHPALRSKIDQPPNERNEQ